MDIDATVHGLIEKHFWKMDNDTSLSDGDHVVLPEDMDSFLNDYSESLNIDIQSFNFRRYFPNTGIWFLPNAILPEYLKTDHHKPEPLTVQMFIESAKAGRWLYD
ncbi:DUF1493 family protein [Klebsiella aerogenes]|uniref:DUF1493 family protein n=1 Tax=Klebsiella aerogenes TaxID=548 RepID=UPI0028A52FF6|nr:DUF1493 family protein [Klebsiella aerogenes]ELI7202403.1 DUF1493 family protein [Klebsiella aerogenes]ELY3902532.1 DUF1493 family protein [Klebsiella aerogenes]HBQ2430192.1 DUF1493 family protein [Klebsiella aerogenes]HBQ2432290.1 DUF1493 family protein [Klebsiella aerogenes]